MYGFLLFILAVLILFTLLPILFGFGVVLSTKSKESSKWFMTMALAVNQFGNASGKYLWNLTLGVGFGNPDEALSSRLGKNKLNKTLKPIGKVLVCILGKLDKNHSINAIEKDEL